MPHRSSTITTARLGEIVEGSASEIYIFDCDDFHFLLVNRGARENLGLSREELAGLHPWDIKPEFDRATFEALVRPLIERALSELRFETVHRRKDGSTYDVAVRLQLLTSDGQPVFFAAIQDITEQKRAWAALREASGKLDAILNNTRMAVFMMDERQHCSFMNAAAEELTGYTFEETRGRPLHDVIHHTHPDGTPFPIEDCAIDRAFPENMQTSGETVFVHKDGSFYPVAFTASPMRNREGRTVGTVIEVRNIEEELRARDALERFNEALQQRVDEALAEREALEHQLVQAQKMEAIGQLSGGIAHDFNNLLQVIGGNLQLMKGDPQVSARSLARVDNALLGVERGAQLAAQLLAFGRKQPLRPQPVLADTVVRGMDDMLRRTLGEAIEIETLTAPDLWTCLADPHQLENALLNLAINARDAMDRAGKLTIEADNVTIDETEARAKPGTVPGDYVVIAVTDTGSGIAREDLARVFDPFFTTKQPGEGTGLGLSMVFGFVKQSGGQVSIYSEPGQGTTVRLYLPRTGQSPQSARPAEPRELPMGSGEAVLVVEDEPDVRATAVEMLASLGYTPVEAADADAALAILEGGARIDVLFTDVVMPGTLRSPELARRARALLPEVAVLFTSGYTANAIVHAGRIDDEVELISKPYSRDQLARKLRLVLEQTRGDGRAAPAAVDEAPPAAPGPRRILVVEDEALIAMLLAETLERLGHTVFEAATLAGAQEILGRETLDVVISDLGLPDGSAEHFIAGLLRDRPELTVVVATGRDLPDALAAAAGDRLQVLAKPFTDAEVARVLGSPAP